MDKAELLTIGSLLINGVLAYSQIKMRAEIAELKVWIYQNFERVTK